MLKHEVQVGAIYRVRLHGNFTDVRIEAEIEGRKSYLPGAKVLTRWQATNLSTGRPVTIKSAAKLRRLVTPAPTASESVQ